MDSPNDDLPSAPFGPGTPVRSSDDIALIASLQSDLRIAHEALREARDIIGRGIAGEKLSPQGKLFLVCEAGECLATIDTTLGGHVALSAVRSCVDVGEKG